MGVTRIRVTAQKMPSRQRLCRILLPLYLAAIYASLGSVRGITNWLRDNSLLRLTVAVLFGVAAVAIVAAFARTAALRNLRSLGVLLVCAAGYALIIWPMESIEEKIHFLEYGLVAWLALEAAPLAWGPVVRFVAVALLVGAAGWLDEGIQGLLPTRHYDLRDVAFNAAAGVMALTTLSLLRWTAKPAAGSPAPLRPSAR